MAARRRIRAIAGVVEEAHDGDRSLLGKSVLRQDLTHLINGDQTRLILVDGAKDIVDPMIALLQLLPQ